jgi:multicomponent Na+:H+ antiporter subunit C
MTEAVLAGVIGFLFAVGSYLVLRRDVVQVVWGVAIISQAANVYLITMSSLSGTAVPIIEGHGDGGAPATVDPLVQALVLTAIVIGFGTTAFALVLTYRTYEEHGTIDMYELAERTADPATPSPATADGATTDQGAEGDATFDVGGTTASDDETFDADDGTPDADEGRPDDDGTLDDSDDDLDDGGDDGGDES